MRLSDKKCCGERKVLPWQDRVKDLSWPDPLNGGLGFFCCPIVNQLVDFMGFIYYS